MVIPASVKALLTRLNDAGYQAYAVGGCVRDSLLGKSPQDWDICTSALPQETKAVFHENRIIETGLKHGTITVLSGGESYEITTFRQDGAYLGHRKPEQVRFVRSLREDLARRDFTVNAMAVDAQGRITDCFGGQEDLKAGCIRCVGDPDTRFTEDALRILRGLRFAAVLGFTIHPDTAGAMERQKNLLKFISGERIFQELGKLLMGSHAAPVLAAYGSVLIPALPELIPVMAQNSPGCSGGLWKQTTDTLSYAPRDPAIRWTLLLHNLANAHGFTPEDPQNTALTGGIFTRLKADTHTKQTVCTMATCLNYFAPATSVGARRWILKFGKELSLPMLEVRRCIALAHGNRDMQLHDLTTLTDLVRNQLEDTPCTGVQDLTVSGRDLMALGIPPGPRIGQLLHQLLEDVTEERCENTPKALLRQLKRYAPEVS